MGHVQRYQGRISDLLMDRIDIHVDVRRVPFEKLVDLGGLRVFDMDQAAVVRSHPGEASRRHLPEVTPHRKQLFTETISFRGQTIFPEQ